MHGRCQPAENRFAGEQSALTADPILALVLRPNPPRLVTVVLAVALILVGVSATVFPLDFVNAALDVVQGYLGTDIAVTTEMAWLFLFAGNALLVAGSLLPGI